MCVGCAATCLASIAASLGCAACNAVGGCAVSLRSLSCARKGPFSTVLSASVECCAVCALRHPRPYSCTGLMR